MDHRPISLRRQHETRRLHHPRHAGGVPNPTGTNFTQTTIQEMAQLPKQRMTQATLRIPFHRQTLDKLNTEKYELTKTGRITFGHPDGTHDDRFWALALAVHAAEQAPHPAHP